MNSFLKIGTGLFVAVFATFATAACLSEQATDDPSADTTGEAQQANTESSASPAPSSPSTPPSTPSSAPLPSPCVVTSAMTAGPWAVNYGTYYGGYAARMPGYALGPGYASVSPGQGYLPLFGYGPLYNTSVNTSGSPSGSPTPATAGGQGTTSPPSSALSNYTLYGLSPRPSTFGGCPPAGH